MIDLYNSRQTNSYKGYRICVRVALECCFGGGDAKRHGRIHRALGSLHRKLFTALELRDMIARADMDGDGEINEEEFIRVMTTKTL